MNKDFKILGYGLSSTVYYNPKTDIVVKEVYKPYGSGESKPSNTFSVGDLVSNEILVNEKIQGIPKLSSFVIPFLGYKIEKTKNLLYFKYVGKSLSQLLDENDKCFAPEILSQISYIKEKVLYITNLLHSYGITHNDLHPGNVYYDLETQVVMIGDFGRGQFIENQEFSLKNKDYEFFVKKLDFEIKYINFRKTISYDDLMKIKIKDKSIKTIKYILLKRGAKEMKYQREKLSYKPKKFLNKIEPIIYENILKNILEKYNII